MATVLASWARISIWKVSDKEVPGDGAALATCLPIALCLPGHGPDLETVYPPSVSQGWGKQVQASRNVLLAFPWSPAPPLPRDSSNNSKEADARPFLLSGCPNCSVLRVREMSMAIVWGWQPGRLCCLCQT